MIRYELGPPLSMMYIRFRSGTSTNSVPYGVENWRETPDALQRVCGSNWSIWRMSYAARAHGWNGMSSSRLSRGSVVTPAPQPPTGWPGTDPRIGLPSGHRGVGGDGAAAGPPARP